MKYFKIPRNTASNSHKSTKDNSNDRNLYKHSMYMQSKSSSWLNRNIGADSSNEPDEPIEEDIRD